MLQQVLSHKRSSALASVFVLAIGLTAAASTPALAQSTPGTVAQFLISPSELLAKSPNGGPGFVAAVRDLVAINPATLQPVLNLLANANRNQKSAIGAGLAQAARRVAKTNPGFAAEIQKAILNTRDQDVVLAFAAGSGDRPIGVAVADGYRTSPTNIDPNVTSRPLFSYASSVSGLGALSDTVASPVSP
ncbi:hypothetical protein [Bradyrhizobium sp. S69]|uniref:hypothetical protein n=1 Tax=Bradyrhizobium sp. S69 TaxID=1641856 RepID=UPI00131C85DC|nr:hypothetical protein [Bradyrhizobium sp. S69]